MRIFASACWFRVLAMGLLAAWILSSAAHGQTAAESQRRPLTGAVSIAPLHSLLDPLIAAANGEPTGAERSKADASRVSILIPPGRSEHGYESPPSRLVQLRDADIVVLVGLGLEPQAEKFLSEHRSQAATRPGGQPGDRRLIRFADVVGVQADPHAHHHHDHAPGEECNHEGPDPHLWLDPVLVEQLADALTREVRALVDGDAAAQARVDEAGAKLRADVRAVHQEYAQASGQFGTKVFVVGHDAWRRMADRYSLKTVAIAGLTASEPTPKALDQAKKAVREHKLRAVFAEPQLSDRAARRIASASGVETRRLDPLGTGDWAGMMRANLAELVRTLGPSSPESNKPADGGESGMGR